MKCTLGGIVKHKKGGYGFKTTFDNSELAQKYKDMFYWIIKNDKIETIMNKGYYDKEE